MGAVEDRWQVAEKAWLARRSIIEREKSREVLQRDERRREGSARSQISISIVGKVEQ
jgi:hypothetical protein